MMMAKSPAPRWWIALAIALSLPFSFHWLLQNVGGLFVDAISTLLYRALVISSLIVSIWWTLRLLRRPQGLRGVRVALGCTVCVVYGAGILLASITSNCAPQSVALATPLPRGGRTVAKIEDCSQDQDQLTYR